MHGIRWNSRKKNNTFYVIIVPYYFTCIIQMIFMLTFWIRENFLVDRNQFQTSLHNEENLLVSLASWISDTLEDIPVKLTLFLSLGRIHPLTRWSWLKERQHFELSLYAIPYIWFLWASNHHFFHVSSRLPILTLLNKYQRSCWKGRREEQWKRRKEKWWKCYRRKRRWSMEYEKK